MNKKNFIYIICSVIIGFFIASAILTVAVGTEETEEDTTAVDEEKLAERRDSIVASNKASSDSDGNHINKDEKDPIEELNELIGLSSVKSEVKSLVNFVRVQKEREKQGLKNTDFSYHLVFTGNPGTGKTTVARILARIYRDLGVLEKGHLVETDRAGMIGEYVGQTAPKVDAMCDSAMGGVLFIDEAYALTSVKSGQDYGSEAVATLLKRMEDDRGKFIVIVAGYTNEMQDFIETNPGLKSRFTRYLHFPDYSSDELYDIYMMRIKKYDFRLTNEASDYLHEILSEAVETKDRNFGNARYARNLFENTITAQADRLGASGLSNFSNTELTLIEREDIEAAKRMTKN